MNDAYVKQFREPAGYLNFASYGPPSQAVVEVMSSVAQAAAEGAPGLHDHDERALTAVARLTGFPRPNCLLSTSTSAGLQQIAFGLPQAEVLVSRDEFPSNLYPWWRAQEAGLLTVRHLESRASTVLKQTTPETVAAALQPTTTAVAVSAVDFRTGYRADLAGLREVIGDRLLLVDGIQGFGVLDQDWTQADALVVGGQKWLRAGWGTGFTALSERALQRLKPTLGSWTGVHSPSNYDGQPHPAHEGAQQLSVTNLSPFTSAALWTALELLEEAGIQHVAAQIEKSAGELISALDAAGLEVLSPRPEKQRAGIVVVRVSAGQAAKTRDRLADQGITVTAHEPDRIRLSVHATTSPNAIDQVTRALRTGAPRRTR